MIQLISVNEHTLFYTNQIYFKNPEG